MYEAMFMAATGITGQQRRLDTIADNIANVNTIGFKSTRVDFKDALYTAGFSPAPAYTPEGDQQKGHGVIAAQANKDFSDGQLNITENELDFAIEGDAFFQVTDPMGRTLYTRAGNFYKSVQDDGSYLVNAQGYYVLNRNGDRIKLPDGASSASVSAEGNITFTSGGEEYYDSFGLYTFTNRTGLSATGGANYEVTVASGEPEPAENFIIRQGVLELSNVQLSREMTLMIRSQRAFQFASRALTTADQMEGIANNMRR